MGWTVDHDEIAVARPILDPLRGAPPGQRGEVEADGACAQPRAAQVDPSGETALRVDVEQCEPSALPGPCHGELRGERRLAGATLALCDRDHQPRHRPRFTRGRRTTSSFSAPLLAGLELRPIWHRSDSGTP